MLRYLFYRAYRNRARDPNETHPQVGAIVGWTFIVGFYLVPIVMYLSGSGYQWVPPFMVRHPSIGSMILAAALMVGAYLLWVRDDSYLLLERIYESEPRWLRQVRAVAFWLVIAGMPLVFIGTVWLMRLQARS